MTENGFLMGVIVAAATWLIICSPYGRRTGAHLNPAITIAYLWLERIHRWDAISYVVAQFTGGLVGVFLADKMLGHRLSAPPVRYVVTLPGHYGRAIAFVAEFVLSGVMMGVVLFATNHRRLTRFSPFFVALLTVFYYGLCWAVSGFSVNPARLDMAGDLDLPGCAVSRYAGRGGHLCPQYGTGPRVLRKSLPRSGVPVSISLPFQGTLHEQ
jgi:aquaporin Z